MGGLLRRVRLLLLPAPLWARGGRKHGPDHERAQQPYPGLGAPYPHLGARPGQAAPDQLAIWSNDNGTFHQIGSRRD